MSPLTFACPKCQATLKPLKPIPAGKKVRCPQCSQVFAPPTTAAASPAEEESWEVVDDAPPTSPKPQAAIPLAATNEPSKATPPPEPPRPRPPRKLQRPAEPEEEFAEEEAEARPRPKKRRKARATGVHQLVKLYLVLGVVTLVLLAGGSLLAVWLYLNWDRNRGSGNEELLAYVPAESRFAFGFDVGALMKQPSVAKYVEKALQQDGDPVNQFFRQVQKDTGLEFKDLFDHTVVAVKPSPIPGRVPEGETLIVKSRVAFDQHKVRDAAKKATSQRYRGTTYFKIMEGSYTTLFMPSNWTIVLTSVPEAQLHALIDSQGSQPGWPAEAVNLARQLAPSPLWAVAPFDATMQQTIQQQLVVAGPMLPAGFAATLQQAKAAGLTGTLEGAAVRFQASLACADEASAKQVVDGLQGLWEKQGKAQLALALTLAPPFVGGLLHEVTDSLHFASQGNLAQASAKVNVPTLETFVKEAQNQAAHFRPGGPGMMVPGGQLRP